MLTVGLSTRKSRRSLVKLTPYFDSYDLKGTPLPLAKDTIFDKLFPLPKADAITVTKAAFTVSPDVKHTYSPLASGLISACPACKGPRVFECQVMPNLINALKSQGEPPNQKKQTDEERKKAIQQALKGGDGMAWGTAMVFSCEKDCCVSVREPTKELKECWREELVLVQWDT